jgi:hypothetical protein
MKQILWCHALLALVVAIGCGGSPPPLVSEATHAEKKVEAFRALADSMAKEPNGMDAKVALENFRNHPLDVTKNKAEADEIVKIYHDRIKGKAQGEVAQEVQMEMAPIEMALKKAN